MMKAAIPALALVIALGGCGTPATPDRNESAAPVNEAALNYQAEVIDLTPAQRNVVMIRAIRDAGIEECQQVTSSEQIGKEGLTYRARCDNGRSHVISIGPDGNAEVQSAAPATGG
jgi:hypothetical protein